MVYLGTIDGRVYPTFSGDGLCGDCGQRAAARGDWLCPQCRRWLEQKIAKARIGEVVCDGDSDPLADPLVID